MLIILAVIYAALRNPRWAALLTFASGIVNTAGFGTAGWISDAGGKVRHDEIRTIEDDSLKVTASALPREGACLLQVIQSV